MTARRHHQALRVLSSLATETLQQLWGEEKYVVDEEKGCYYTKRVAKIAHYAQRQLNRLQVIREFKRGNETIKSICKQHGYTNAADINSAAWIGETKGERKQKKKDKVNNKTQVIRPQRKPALKASFNFTIHTLAAVTHHGGVEIEEGAPKGTVEVMHLCGEGKANGKHNGCINPEHLAYGSSALNNSMRGCPVFAVTKFRGEEVIALACTHKTKDGRRCIGSKSLEQRYAAQQKEQ